MKYCLRSRCQSTYLNRVDEIKVEWRDRKSIPDVAMKYPEADIILQFTPTQYRPEDFDIEEIFEYNTIAQGKFICCVNDIAMISTFVSSGVRAYWGFPVESLYELVALHDAGACYARLGAGLFFQMDNVKAVGIPIRAVPNVAYGDGHKRENGLIGQWIHPDHVNMYEPYIACLEFEDADVRKEQALYRVYKQDGWPTDLKDLITNLDCSMTGQLITPDFTRRRLNCGQRCLGTGSCRLCYLVANIADREKMQQLLDTINRD
jgi:hypothetical protein